MNCECRVIVVKHIIGAQSPKRNNTKMSCSTCDLNSDITCRNSGAIISSKSNCCNLIVHSPKRSQKGS